MTELLSKKSSKSMRPLDEKESLGDDMQGSFSTFVSWNYDGRNRARWW